jgi:hypothetical protein
MSSKTIFLLGAGASKKAGVPLMKNFLDEAYDLWQQQKLGEEDAEHFKKVFNGISALQRVHSKSRLDINNLESVFATFEMAKLLNKMPNFRPKEIDNLIKSLKRLIVVTIEKKLKLPRRDHNVYPPEPYDEFIDLVKKLSTKSIPKQEVSILTFNYDIALDFALHAKRMGPNYCLDAHAASNEAINLLKLHGSLNWSTSIDNNQIIPWDLRDYFAHYSFGRGVTKWAKLGIGTHLKTFNELNNFTEIDGEPVIVPPTWNKSNYHNDLSEIWSQSAKELEKAENLFIIGFSLPETDVFFRHLYALGTAGQTPLKKFWVFDPDNSGKVEKRYQQLLGPGAKARFNYLQNTFSEAISIIERQFDYRN